MVYIVVLIVILLDQMVKLLVMEKMKVSESIPIIKDVFHLTYVQNRGAAFGILPGRRYLFIVITVVVISFLLIYYYKTRGSGMVTLSTGLIIGGALGNLIDRIRFGYVVDYLDFRIWPVFNLADSSVVIGAALLILYLWQQEKVGD
ncbi:signal peptidase II [Halothermothrix orenii]|uniref:Lipoprotein signal peptidase n=1 Tax=Halothermothrix orenii (strain H 168 / OCM 544 / DSM 9562) TaxID=373903 RepID=LSPA_HALOH|nr:signal peptidase II [Halothermothrix orenii]B8CWL9.1 RecName: Full=Lipoprotein signal peptidase; AltName: Full=Prolipoprotein signal peptidase; AltName: Full=Signal peptidase II; Short=SPase II [Halothermothrix orenii H 168]ACL69688.1 lipoprotein signal peptidase [Halothermothrix orenii H 168]